jgi:UDPglucose--hexose-1-phosphate uridylyltransferase
VIVHCSQHATALAELDPSQLATAVAAWRARMAAHADAAYVQLIVNEGPQAGASLEHSHAQLYALDFVPALVARERERFATYHEQTMGGHLLDEILVEEIRNGERVVAVDDEAALLCPWASPSPFALRIVPRSSVPDFAASEGCEAMLATAVRGLGAVFGRPPQLNLWVRTAPRGAGEFCWRIDIAPRLTIRAGFELSTGVEINVYPPERAAADLRSALDRS